jgi:hypothetical protein
MTISMLSTHSYKMGARRQQWMLFRPPFLTTCERFVKNTRSSRIKLIKRLFYRFILSQALKHFFPTPFEEVACVRSGVYIVYTP